jgi:hypothetical protein
MLRGTDESAVESMAEAADPYVVHMGGKNDTKHHASVFA